MSNRPANKSNVHDKVPLGNSHLELSGKMQSQSLSLGEKAPALNRKFITQLATNATAVAADGNDMVITTSTDYSPTAFNLTGVTAGSIVLVSVLDDGGNSNAVSVSAAIDAADPTTYVITPAGVAAGDPGPARYRVLIL